MHSNVFRLGGLEAITVRHLHRRRHGVGGYYYPHRLYRRLLNQLLALPALRCWTTDRVHLHSDCHHPVFHCRHVAPCLLSLVECLPLTPWYLLLQLARHHH